MLPSSPAEIANFESGVNVASSTQLKKGARPEQWLAKSLDPVVVGSDGCLVAYDIEGKDVEPYKASDGEVFYATDQASLDYKQPTVYPTPLRHELAERFVSSFVDALVGEFPAIKKTKYGERAK